MRSFIILGFCLVAAFAAPLSDDNTAAFNALAELDDGEFLAPSDVSETEVKRVVKRTIDDQTLEARTYQSSFFCYFFRISALTKMLI